MDISKIAAYFIYCSEDVTAGNDIYFSVEFKKPYDKSGLFVSYKQFIQENTIMQQKFVVKENMANWEPLEKHELDRLLEIEKERLSYYHKAEDVYQGYTPTNKTLPVKIYPINEKQIVFAVNHVYTNGYGALYWLNEWLGYTLDEKIEKNTGLPAISSAEKSNFLKRIPYKVSSMINAICYITSFRKNAGKDFYGRSIHCLRHDYSINHKQRYKFVSYNFDEKETSIVIKNAKLNKQTISGYFTSILCKVLYEKYADKDRICITYPFDIRKDLGLSNKEIGNYTSNLTIQVFRNDNIDKQIRCQYELKNKGIPYGIANLIRITSNEKNIRSNITDNCQKKFEERGVDQLTPFAFSNLGHIDYPLVKHKVDKISFYLKSQSILIGCCALNNRLSISLSFSKDLYPVDEVVDIINEVIIKAKVF